MKWKFISFVSIHLKFHLKECLPYNMGIGAIKLGPVKVSVPSQDSQSIRWSGITFSYIAIDCELTLL